MTTILRPIVIGPNGTPEGIQVDQATLDVVLGAISDQATRFTMETVLGREHVGHGGFCDCPDGHSGLPITYVEYTAESSPLGSSFYVYYCDAA